MTRKANRRFLALGAACAVLCLAAGHWRQAIGPTLADFLVPALMLASFFLVVVLGIAPWMGSFALRHPIQNTQGYLPDYAAEPERETGGIYSQGWRRKRERAGLRFAKAAGLTIEPDGKG